MSYKINGIEMVTASEIVEATGWTRITIDKKMKRFNYAHISLKPKEIKGLYERYGRVWNGCPSKLNLYPLSVKEELVSMSKRRRNPLNALATIPAVEEEKEENGTMSSLMAGIIAESPEFGKVRIVRDENDECYMVASDVAKALQYERPDVIISKHLDYEDKFTLKYNDEALKIQNFQIGRNSVITGSVGFDVPPRGFTVINESGMYALIFRSKLPSAKRFKHWVTSEVLPSIRKNGGYHDIDRMQSQLDSMKEAMDRIERTTKNVWMALGASSAATKSIIEMC